MSFYMCKILFKSVQVSACYCKMFKGLTFSWTQCSNRYSTVIYFSLYELNAYLMSIFTGGKGCISSIEQLRQLFAGFA